VARSNLVIASHCEAFLERERRHNYTTPKSFLELIELYKRMLLQAHVIPK
jgi:dynein heavy chain